MQKRRRKRLPSGDSAGAATSAAEEEEAGELTCVCSLPLPARPFNPFHHRARVLWYHWLTVPLFGLLVFPVRLVLLLLCLAGAFLVSLATQIGGPPRPPLSPWRRFIADNLLFSLGRAGSFVGGFAKVVVTGRRADVREAPIVVAAPHTSLVDAAIFFCLRPLLAPVVKAQRNFFYNVMLPAGESLIVHRDSRRMRARAADELVARAHSGGRYRQLLAFPEGTCTNGRALIGFRSGAFSPGVPVQPLLIRHRDPLQLQCWAVDGPSMFYVIFRCGARLYSELHLEFLPVYHPSEAEKADPQLYANNVRDAMARQAQLPVTDQSHTDVLLFKAARRRGLPGLGFPLSGLRRLLRRLLAASRAELLAQLAPGPARPRCPHELAAEVHRVGGAGGGPDAGQLEPGMRLVFDLFDRTGCGRIDPRELYIAAALLRWPEAAADTLREALLRLSSAADSPSQEVVDSVAMETVLFGIVGMTTDLCRTVMSSAPVTRRSGGLDSADSCLSHLMRFKQLQNLLRLHTDLASIIS